MTELQDIEHEINSLREKLARLRKRAEEIRKHQQLAYFEDVRVRITKIQKAVEGLRAEGKVRTNLPQTSRYYLLDGKKYPVHQGRLFKALSDYKNRGGNLQDLLHVEPAAEPIPEILPEYRRS